MNRIARAVHILAVLSVAAIGCPERAAAVTFKSVFYGTITWTGVSNCPRQRAGYVFASQYHPRRPSPASENYAGLTTMYTHEGAVYRLDGAGFTTAFQPVEGIYTGAAGYPIRGASIRILETDPASVTPSTQYLSVKGQIKAPWGEVGTNGQTCIVLFLANYFRGAE